jgi:hypothetical protein
VPPFVDTDDQEVHGMRKTPMISVKAATGLLDAITKD